MRLLDLPDELLPAITGAVQDRSDQGRLRATCTALRGHVSRELQELHVRLGPLSSFDPAWVINIFPNLRRLRVDGLQAHYNRRGDRPRLPEGLEVLELTEVGAFWEWEVMLELPEGCAVHVVAAYPYFSAAFTLCRQETPFARHVASVRCTNFSWDCCIFSAGFTRLEHVDLAVTEADLGILELTLQSLLDCPSFRSLRYSWFQTSHFKMTHERPIMTVWPSDCRLECTDCELDVGDVCLMVGELLPGLKELQLEDFLCGCVLELSRLDKLEHLLVLSAYPCYCLLEMPSLLTLHGNLALLSQDTWEPDMFPRLEMLQLNNPQDLNFRSLKQLARQPGMRRIVVATRCDHVLTEAASEVLLKGFNGWRGEFEEGTLTLQRDPVRLLSSVCNTQRGAALSLAEAGPRAGGGLRVPGVDEEPRAPVLRGRPVLPGHQDLPGRAGRVHALQRRGVRGLLHGRAAA